MNVGRSPGTDDANASRRPSPAPYRWSSYRSNATGLASVIVILALPAGRDHRGDFPRRRINHDPLGGQRSEERRVGKEGRSLVGSGDVGEKRESGAMMSSRRRTTE